MSKKEKRVGLFEQADDRDAGLSGMDGMRTVAMHA
jgi:hypothetical protein